MSLVQKVEINWKPTTTREALKLRAKFYAAIRAFFHERDVLEVETPSLCQHSVTDACINSFKTFYAGVSEKVAYFLQTSPEYAMKRLLAAGSGSIYQIGKAFRNESQGAYHNPEFSMLEWYRLGFSYHDLMDEVDDFLQVTLGEKKAERNSYQAIFQDYLNIDPFTVSIDSLQVLAENFSLDNARQYRDRDDLLLFLFSRAIEPTIGFDAPVFVYDFPATQAALAKINPKMPHTAQRFEVYIRGLECANGFDELTHPIEQRKRFEKDNEKRCAHHVEAMKIDERFLSALSHGLPNCSGVAVGLDRLLMVKAKTKQIRDVISFPVDIA